MQSFVLAAAFCLLLIPAATSMAQTWNTQVFAPFSGIGNQEYAGYSQLTAASDGNLYGALPGYMLDQNAYYGAIISIPPSGQLSVFHTIGGVRGFWTAKGCELPQDTSMGCAAPASQSRSGRGDKRLRWRGRE